MNESKEQTKEKAKEKPIKLPSTKQKPKPPIVTPNAVSPNAELLDLTEGNFVAVMQKLGGRDVTTGQMLPYFAISKDPKPQHRWPKLRVMANKLSKTEPPKVTVVKDGKRFKYSLSGTMS